MQSRAGWCCAVLVVLLTACSGRRPPGASCRSDAECVTDRCVGICTEQCTTDEDCSFGRCGSSDGRGSYFCTEECNVSGVALPMREDWFCDGQQPRPCAEGGAALACATCGCPDGNVCLPTNACAQPRGVGETCTLNIECESGNCGAVALDRGVCFVAAGAACDGSNCGQCVRRSDGTSECLQACDFLTERNCPGNDPARPQPLCWASSAEREGFYCRLSCTTQTCPDGFRCRMVGDSDGIIRNRCFPIELIAGPASMP
jgi:hypothetical protein